MLTADISAETLQARRDWKDIFKVMKGKNLQPKLLGPASISFRFNREIKSFTDRQKLREFSITKLDLQQMLKELLSLSRKHKRQLVRKKITNLKESKEGFIFPGRSMVFQFIVKLEKLDR